MKHKNPCRHIAHMGGWDWDKAGNMKIKVVNYTVCWKSAIENVLVAS
jgi:hypothetical protein